MADQYKYLDEYIHGLRAAGKYSFSTDDLRQHFDFSDEAIKKSLQRLKRQKLIAQVRKGFYVVVPPEYDARGIIPTSFFVDDLMKYLERPYYIGLLNAAAFYGAAHQQPQQFTVITSGIPLRKIETDRLAIYFLTKKKWDDLAIVQKKVDTAYVNVSSPELTALDIVNYLDNAGGINRAATVIDELIEEMDSNRLTAVARKYDNTAAVQRLGYILEYIFENDELADALYQHLQTIEFFTALLRPQKERPDSMATGNRWKIVVNVEIQCRYISQI